MNTAYEILPICAFLIAWYLSGDFFIGTKVLIGATLLGLAYHFLFQNRQPAKKYLGPALVVAFSGMSLLTHNEVFLVMKATIMYFITAASIIISQFIFGQSLLEKGFKLAEISAPEYCWRRLDISLASAFLLMSVLNYLVFKHYGVVTWGKFKACSLLIWFTLFIPLAVHIEKHAKPNTAPND